MIRIMKACWMLCLAFSLGGLALAEEAKDPKADKESSVVVMHTNKGDIEIELYPDQAPITVKNFLRYVDEGFYEGTVFHRVIPGFMIQGGGMTPDLERKPTHEAIKNEADNGLKNETGTISMARTSNPDSASSQFFINTADNANLDHSGPGPRFGYAVFGKVTAGMDVVRAIEAVATTTRSQHGNVPVETVVIESVARK